MSVIRANPSKHQKMFYQNILKDISHLNNDVITRLKTKFQHTCDKYSRIKVSYKYRNAIISNLRRNKQLIILKQERKSEYTVQSTKDLVNFNKPNKMPSSHQLISFDVVSLFTNEPIDSLTTLTTLLDV